MIETVKEKLKELDPNVQYGICRKQEEQDTWDCLLIRKRRWTKNGKSNTDESFYLTVTIVREDEIPEGMEKKVEKEMGLVGFRRTSKDAEYDYTIDTNDIVVELCTIEFVKAYKGRKL